MLRWLQQGLQVAVVVLLGVALLLLFWNLSTALVTVPPRSATNPPTTTGTSQGGAAAQPNTGNQEKPAATGTSAGGSGGIAPTVPVTGSGSTGINPSPTVPVPTGPGLPTVSSYTATGGAPAPTVPAPSPQPAPAPQPAPNPAPLPPAPTPASGAGSGPAPYFSPPPVLSAYFYGQGSSLFFNPKKESGRISIQFTTDPKIPLTVSGFELEYSGTLQIGNALLEVWPVPQKQIIGQSSGGAGHYVWTAQKPFVVGDGAVSYTITFTATGHGKLDIKTARVLYLENGQPRSLEAHLSGATLWGQEFFDDPLRAATGDLFWSQFVVTGRLANGLYLLNKLNTTEPYVLYYAPAQGTLFVGDRLVVRAIWTGQRLGGVPELDASGPDGYVKLLPLP